MEIALYSDDKTNKSSQGKWNLICGDHTKRLLIAGTISSLKSENMKAVDCKVIFKGHKHISHQVH